MFLDGLPLATSLTDSIMNNRLCYLFFVLLFVLFGLNSCTIKKRLYGPGYHVDWHNTKVKSNTHPENESRILQETVHEEKLVVDNSNEIIQNGNQSKTSQDIEPIFASNVENTENADIINSTKQKKSISYRIKDIDSETNKTIILDKNNTTTDKYNSEEPVSVFASTGLVLSIISMIMIIGSLFSTNVVLFIFLFYPGCLIGILGALFSITSLIIILVNPGKRGLGLVIASLIMPLISLLLTLIALRFN